MPRPLLLNHVVLFLCCSLLLGIGVGVVLFRLPLAPQLGPDDYAAFFAGPVREAPGYFTWITVVMPVTGLVMLVSEWFTGIRWVPIVVLAALAAVTLLTCLLIFPYHEELAGGIRDPARLREVVSQWADLHRLRAALWAVMWAAMMYWFYRLAWQARADR